MKLLFENWRKYVLTEGMKTVDDLLNFKDEEFPDEELKIYIRVREEGNITYISYASIDDRGRIYNLGYNDAINGRIGIIPSEHKENGPCAGAWQVFWSSATPGWGPLLYDIAIEYATLNGNGLIPDRKEVSKNARRVWDKYVNSRTVDGVDNHQLDDLNNTLTDIYTDNCNQNISGDGDEWQKSPLSKRYTKAPTTINKLGDRYINKI
jgi:hypothetical protein